jgi:hypothetical protein
MMQGWMLLVMYFHCVLALLHHEVCVISLSGIKRQFQFLSMCREQLGTSWEETKIMYTYPQNTQCYHISTAFLYHNRDSWGLNLECCAAAVVAAVRFPCVYCLFIVSVLKQRETIRDSTVL